MAELQAIDELVRERTELTIHSGLSLQLPPAGESALANIWNSDSSLQHSGLNSLSALARMEVAGMLAGHLPRRNPIPIPLRPRPAERELYLEFLRDAVMFHAFSAIVERPKLQTITPAEVLTYERRIMQAEKLAGLFYELTGATLNRDELAELRNIQKSLAQIGKPIRDSLTIGASLSDPG